MNKLEELQKLRGQVNLTVNGLENYPKNETNILIPNHNCLMDIFYLPMVLPEEIISIISARLIYKNDEERKATINRYLHAFPIEAHGGRMYASICLEQASRFLTSGLSLSIFPEGAYVPDNKVFKGHTGGSRILFSARENGTHVNLIPVSIYVSRNYDLDNYSMVGDDVEVTILPPVDYEEAYYNYSYSRTIEEMNAALHRPIDDAMQSIAATLKVPYEDAYIELWPKGNVIFADGSVVDVGTAQEEQYIKRYNQELDDRAQRLIRSLR